MSRFLLSLYLKEIKPGFHLSCFLFFLTALFFSGCPGSSPAPSPDGDVPESNFLTIVSPPARDIGLFPGDSVTLKVLHTSSDGTPLPDRKVSFALLGETGGSTLENPETMTDSDGMARMLLMAGYDEVFFDVEVTAAAAASVRYNVAVSDAGFGSLIVHTDYEGILSPENFDRIESSLYYSRNCKDLRGRDLIEGEKTRTMESIQDHAVFDFLPLSAPYTVTVIAWGSNNEIKTFGCIELKPYVLKTNVTLETLIPMKDILPQPASKYHSRSTISLTLEDAPIIQNSCRPWVALGSCKYGCAQSFLDCLEAALERPWENPWELSCDPVEPTSEIGKDIEAFRGQLTEGCRGDFTSGGLSSLEKTIQESACNQESFSNIQSLAQNVCNDLTSFILTSIMTFRSTGQPNQWVVDHTLGSARFTEVPNDLTVDFIDLGNPLLAVRSVSTEILAGYPSILFFESHGFSMRPGKLFLQVLNQAYLGSSKSGVRWGLENLYTADEEDYEPACDRLDFIICREIDRPPGCLEESCETAFESMAYNLEEGFMSMDATGVDLSLHGGWASMTNISLEFEAQRLGSQSSPGNWNATIKFSHDTVLDLDIPFVAHKPLIPVP